jgi:hypothetical protein
LLTTRAALGPGSSPASTVTPYVSRFCYVAALGIAWMGWKAGMVGSVLTTGGGGFVIWRSTDATGAPTGDAIHVMANNVAATGSATSNGPVQVISNLAGAVSSFTGVNSAWAVQPYGLTSSLYAGNSQVFPVFQYTPIVGISASLGIALVSEIAIGSTVVLALLGATTHTFIQAGGTPWAGSTLGAAVSGTPVIGALMPWE